jgi:RimJ/RimL family protein N-acetyltransferase
MEHLRLQGQQVRLVALNSDSDQLVMERWPVALGMWRLLDADGADRHGPDRAPAADGVYFRVHALAEDRPIGHAGLFGICRRHGDAWLDVRLSTREHWGEPYGADTLRLLLRYAFDGLGLNRVALGVFEYDARRMRALEGAGFAIEGRVLQESSHGLQRRAGLLMGLRRETWTG